MICVQVPLKEVGESELDPKVYQMVGNSWEQPITRLVRR